MGFALEAGSDEEVLLVNVDVGKGAWGLGVQLLEVLEESRDRFVAVHLAEGVVVAEKGVAVAGDGQGLENHGAARRHVLDVSEHRSIPVHHL